MTDQHIKRHANGSIDTAFYMARGRVQRSEAVFDLGARVRRAGGALTRGMPGLGTRK